MYDHEVDGHHTDSQTDASSVGDDSDIDDNDDVGEDSLVRIQGLVQRGEQRCVRDARSFTDSFREAHERYQSGEMDEGAWKRRADELIREGFAGVRSLARWIDREVSREVGSVIESEGFSEARPAAVRSLRTIREIVAKGTTSLLRDFRADAESKEEEGFAADGIAAAGGRVIEGYRRGGNIFRSIRNAFTKGISKPFKKFGKKFTDGFKKVGRAMKKVKQGLGKIKKGFEAFGNIIKNAFKALGKVVMKIVNGIKKGFSKLFNMLKKIPKWVLKVIKPVIKVFIGIGEAAVAIGKLFADLATNPFRAIARILMVIFGVVFGVTLLLAYIILSMGPSILIGIVFAWGSAILIAILLTVLYMAIVVLATVVFTIIWVLNIMTGGALTFLLRCENEPDAWHDAPGYGQGNGYKRFLFCFAPCSAGWSRTFGAFCRKEQGSCPHFCPQQQIYMYYRAADERESVLPYMFGTYVPDTSFYSKPAKKRRALLLKSLDAKKRFLGSCAVKLRPYDFLNRHVCANLDVIPKSALTDENRTRLRAMCKQAYCDYEVVRGNDGAPIARPGTSAARKWCGGLDAAPDKSNDARHDSLREFLICILLLIITVTGALIVIVLQSYMPIAGVGVAHS